MAKNKTTSTKETESGDVALFDSRDSETQSGLHADAVSSGDEGQLAEEGQETIRTGQVYKEQNGTREVIPYHVDFTAATVNFADVGRSNEDRMRTSDFLNRFELQGSATLSGDAVPKEETGQLDSLDENGNASSTTVKDRTINNGRA